jgi:hypothetical protein
VLADLNTPADNMTRYFARTERMSASARASWHPASQIRSLPWIPDMDSVTIPTFSSMFHPADGSPSPSSLFTVHFGSATDVWPSATSSPSITLSPLASSNPPVSTDYQTSTVLSPSYSLSVAGEPSMSGEHIKSPGSSSVQELTSEYLSPSRSFTLITESRLPSPSITPDISDSRSLPAITSHIDVPTEFSSVLTSVTIVTVNHPRPLPTASESEEDTHLTHPSLVLSCSESESHSFSIRETSPLRTSTDSSGFEFNATSAFSHIPMTSTFADEDSFHPNESVYAPKVPTEEKEESRSRFWSPSTREVHASPSESQTPVGSVFTDRFSLVEESVVFLSSSRTQIESEWTYDTEYSVEDRISVSLTKIVRASTNEDTGGDTAFSALLEVEEESLNILLIVLKIGRAHV